MSSSSHSREKVSQQRTQSDMKCIDGSLKHDQNKQMTEDVTRHHLSIFYANMECTVYFNGFYTPTKICAFSQYFIIFLLHVPIIQWKLYQNVFGGLVRRLKLIQRTNCRSLC